jgi:hypothetical protein
MLHQLLLRILFRNCTEFFKRNYSTLAAASFAETSYNKLNIPAVFLSILTCPAEILIEERTGEIRELSGKLMHPPTPPKKYGVILVPRLRFAFTILPRSHRTFYSKFKPVTNCNSSSHRVELPFPYVFFQ